MAIVREIESRVPPEIRSVQEKKFAALMREVLRNNLFYQQKYDPLGFSAERPAGLSDRADLPLTQRSELVEDQREHPPFGSNLSYPVSRYTRLHYGREVPSSPLCWLDTPESWSWWLDCWDDVYEAAGVTEDDRVLIACLAGPRVGCWPAMEAGQRRGALMIAGGELDPQERLDAVLRHEVSVLLATTDEAMRLAEIAVQKGDDPKRGPVRVTIHPERPEAGMHEVRSRVASLWGAEPFYQIGSTEIGAWGFGCGERDRVHVNETEFLAEVLDPSTRERAPADDDGVQCGELVLTNLGRVGSPLIRYATGHLVQFSRQRCECGRTTAVLRNGGR